MLKQIYSNKFRKDIAKSIKRGKDVSKLEKIVTILVANKALPKKYKDHNLVGNYVGRRECHIEPDWLLIYKKEKDQIIFERIGTHSDLFR